MHSYLGTVHIVTVLTTCNVASCKQAFSCECVHKLGELLCDAAIMCTCQNLFTTEIGMYTHDTLNVDSASTYYT